MAIGQQEMMRASEGRLCVGFTRLDEKPSSMKEEVLTALERRPKQVLPKYLYDERGSLLFDLICDLPEYYLTRTEISILKRYGRQIAAMLDGSICLIELGAGACQKSSFLLDTGAVATFVPVDICGEFLWESLRALSHTFPRVRHHAIAMDFLDGLGRLAPLLPDQGTRLIFFAGSSIGNFDPPDAHHLLLQFHRLLRVGDAVLIGYDLRKDPDILHKAYNDAQGLTAAFNLNLLARFNRELRADFNLNAFRHVAFYNDVDGRIEMHLESMIPHEVHIAGRTFFFRRRETLHTENSYKYTHEGFEALANGAGFERAGVWTDSDALFALELYVPK